MKKRVYKATKVKKLNLEKLINEAEGKEIILSVDGVKEDFQAVLVSKN